MARERWRGTALSTPSSSASRIQPNKPTSGCGIGYSNFRAKQTKALSLLKLFHIWGFKAFLGAFQSVRSEVFESFRLRIGISTIFRSTFLVAYFPLEVHLHISSQKLLKCFYFEGVKFSNYKILKASDQKPLKSFRLSPLTGFRKLLMRSFERPLILMRSFQKLLMISF